jgi:hypothetical protein
MTTDPTQLGESDPADYARRLIAARCLELSDADLALLGASAPDPDAIPGRIGMEIMQVVEAMADRLDGFQEQLAVLRART